MVLVTGPTGQVGRQLISELAARGDFVIALSGSQPDPAMPVQEWIPWRYDSTSRLPPWQFRIDAVIHLAAQTSAYKARRDPVLDLQQNVARFVTLLDSLRLQDKPPRVVTTGAATELGTHSVTLDDQVAPRPATFYDVGKVSQSLYLRQYAAEGWLTGVHLRMTNIYGGRRAGKATHRGFINRSINAALTGQALTLYRGVDGRRDMLHVSDAVRALLCAMDMPDQDAGSEYIVGSGESLTLHDSLSRIARCVSTRTGSTIGISVVDPPQDLYAIEMRDVVVDSSQFRADASWEPRIPFDTGIQMYVDDALNSRANT
jgi:UDP-glucose 4-epimerase